MFKDRTRLICYKLDNGTYKVAIMGYCGRWVIVQNAIGDSPESALKMLIDFLNVELYSAEHKLYVALNYKLEMTDLKKLKADGVIDYQEEN